MCTHLPGRIKGAAPLLFLLNFLYDGGLDLLGCPGSICPGLGSAARLRGPRQALGFGLSSSALLLCALRLLLLGVPVSHCDLQLLAHLPA